MNVLKKQASTKTPTIAISVDVEDGINIAMRDIFKKKMAPTARVVTNTEIILELMDKHNTIGTFFTLGQVAEYYPDLVKKIHKKGHEIAVHGYDHYRFDKMNPDLAHSQLSRAKSLLEDLTGEKVIGHRAPAFSINEHTSWALPLLAELGFEYDSSVMPCRALHYGWPQFPDEVLEVKFNDGNSIIEIPMTTISLGSRNIPFLGGSYFRLLPYSLTSMGIYRTSEKKSPVFYMHPYEIDPVRYPDYYFEELKKSGLVSELKMRSMWINRKSVGEKLERLVSENSTCTMAAIFKEQHSDINLKSVKLSELSS